MRKDSAEYCSSCHKVHLDEPVNHYRWLRGFNEYDNWQASGVSGQGARSFYYPAKSVDLLGLPHADGSVARSRQSQRHDSLASIPGSEYGGGIRQSTMRSNCEPRSSSCNPDSSRWICSQPAPVDEAKGDTEMRRRASDAPAIASTFAVGEEAEQAAPAVLREVGKLAGADRDARRTLRSRAPPCASMRWFARARSAISFPAGTVDAYDVWLEFKACDATGRVLAWSGRVEDEGRGPVEPGAHFYRSYQIDGQGNPINKRNAWQTRSVLYVRLIPPGAADTVHFRLPIPRDAVGPITLEARLNYRKFAHYYTKFAFAGVAKPGPAGLAFDSREYTLRLRAHTPPADRHTLPVPPARSNWAKPHWEPMVRKQDRERWNDWGIGLLLQGDLKAAEYAFRRVTEAEPEYADGWLNVGRALIQEGETDRARPFVEKALALQPEPGPRALLHGHGAKGRRRLRWRPPQPRARPSASIRGIA